MCVCVYLEDEVWRCAWSHSRSEDPIVVRVDQRLVQIQHQNLPLHSIWRECEEATQTK